MTAVVGDVKVTAGIVQLPEGPVVNILVCRLDERGVWAVSDESETTKPFESIADALANLKTVDVVYIATELNAGRYPGQDWDSNVLTFRR